MTPATLRAKRLLTDAGSALRGDVSLTYNERIVSIDSATALPANADTLVMPPFCNAHDHGRGLRPIAYGAADAALEAWVPATYTLPPIDPYLVAAAAFARMARAGIGSVVHCHLGREPAALIREAQAVKRAAEDIGIRVAFVVPMRDRHRLVYGPDEALLALMKPEDAAGVSSRWLRPLASVEVQVETALRIIEECESPLFQPQLGPTGVERCSHEILDAVSRLSESLGRRVHMHLLESKYQREWADVAYPQGIITHLRDVGLLSPRLTVAHAVWLRPAECEMLAAHGVTVSVNTSSNLRLRSGIAPVADFRAAKLDFALGLDALGLDDDDDMAREMRLVRLLHRARGFDDGLGAEEVLAATLEGGARVSSSEPAPGRIAVGGRADFVELDFAAMTADTAEGLYDPLDLLHSRATARHVRRLVVRGRTVVQGGKVTGVDQDAIEHELQAELLKAAPSLIAAKPLVKSYQSALERYYRGGGHCH